MSYAVMTDKPVVCRKVHPCTWCGGRILAGDPAQYRTGISDGGYSSGWEHPECYRAILGSDDLYDGYVLHEQQRGKTMEESDR